MGLIKRIITQDRNLQHIQDNIESSLKGMQNSAANTADTLNTSVTANSASITTLQSQVAALTAALSASPIASGKMVYSVTANSGLTNTVAHGLGRTPIGVFTVYNGTVGYSGEIIYRQFGPTTFMIDNAAGTSNVTVDVWVF